MPAKPTKFEHGYTSNHDRLLETIAAHPNDVAAKLVYADWLEENGKPGIANAIRLHYSKRARDTGDVLPQAQFNPGSKLRHAGMAEVDHGSPYVQVQAFKEDGNPASHYSISVELPRKIKTRDPILHRHIASFLTTNKEIARQVVDDMTPTQGGKEDGGYKRFLDHLSELDKEEPKQMSKDAQTAKFSAKALAFANKVKHHKGGTNYAGDAAVAQFSKEQPEQFARASKTQLPFPTSANVPAGSDIHIDDLVHHLNQHAGSEKRITFVSHTNTEASKTKKTGEVNPYQMITKYVTRTGVLNCDYDKWAREKAAAEGKTYTPGKSWMSAGTDHAGRLTPFATHPDGDMYLRVMHQKQISDPVYYGHKEDGSTEQLDPSNPTHKKILDTFVPKGYEPPINVFSLPGIKHVIFNQKSHRVRHDGPPTVADAPSVPEVTKTPPAEAPMPVQPKEPTPERETVPIGGMAAKADKPKSQWRLGADEQIKGSRLGYHLGQIVRKHKQDNPEIAELAKSLIRGESTEFSKLGAALKEAGDKEHANAYRWDYVAKGLNLDRTVRSFVKKWNVTSKSGENHFFKLAQAIQTFRPDAKHPETQKPAKATGEWVKFWDKLAKAAKATGVFGTGSGDQQRVLEAVRRSLIRNGNRHDDLNSSNRSVDRKALPAFSGKPSSAKNAERFKKKTKPKRFGVLDDYDPAKYPSLLDLQQQRKHEPRHQPDLDDVFGVTQSPQATPKQSAPAQTIAAHRKAIANNWRLEKQLREANERDSKLPQAPPAPQNDPATLEAPKNAVGLASAPPPPAPPKGIKPPQDWVTPNFTKHKAVHQWSHDNPGYIDLTHINSGDAEKELTKAKKAGFYVARITFRDKITRTHQQLAAYIGRNKAEAMELGNMHRELIKLRKKADRNAEALGVRDNPYESWKKGGNTTLEWRDGETITIHQRAVEVVNEMRKLLGHKQGLTFVGGKAINDNPGLHIHGARLSLQKKEQPKRFAESEQPKINLRHVRPEFKFGVEQRTWTTPVPGDFRRTFHPTQAWMGFHQEHMGDKEGEFYRQNRRKALLTPLGMELHHLAANYRGTTVGDIAAVILKKGLTHQTAFGVLGDALMDRGHDGTCATMDCHWQHVPRKLWAQEVARHVGRVYGIDPGQIATNTMNDADAYNSLYAALKGDGSFQHTVDQRPARGYHNGTIHYPPDHDKIGVPPHDPSPYHGYDDSHSEEMRDAVHCVEGFHDPDEREKHKAAIKHNYDTLRDDTSFRMGKKTQPKRFAKQENRSIARSLMELNSQQQHKLRQIASQILHKHKLTPHRLADALHDTPTESKPGIAQAILRPVSPEHTRRAAAQYGLMSGQNSLLVFHGHPDGPDSLYAISMDGMGGNDVRKHLDSAGLTRRTLIPTDTGFRVLIHDKNRQARPQVEAFANAHGKPVDEATGFGEHIGGHGVQN